MEKLHPDVDWAPRDGYGDHYEYIETPIGRIEVVPHGDGVIRG